MIEVRSMILCNFINLQNLNHNFNLFVLSIHPEPVNKRDENAIVVKALLRVWIPTGYIPAPKVPKVTDAMRKNEITSVVLNNVIYKYIYAYFAKILLLKRNRWLPNNVNYEYNDPI